MVEHPSSHSDVKNPVIRRGSVDFIDVYEVKVKWTPCRGQNTGKISKIFEIA